MDLTGIVIRVLVTYGVLLLLVRASGKMSVRHGTTFDFLLSVIIGDMVDNAILAEVEMSTFLAGVATLFAAHWAMKDINYRVGAHGGYGGSD
jgi:uncharacterized membrane protein YcaP (DUF421 family)